MSENIPIAPHKEDRRIQRTKRLLRDALMALIVERGAWEPITIQEITDRANVSRTTFYLHFRDKEELMYKTMEEEYDEMLVQFIERKQIPGNLGEPDLTEFQHVARYSSFYRIMLGPKGSAAFVERVHTYLARTYRDFIGTMYDVTDLGLDRLDMLGHFLAGAEIGLIRWWLENGMVLSPLEMAKRVDELCLHGAGAFIETVVSSRGSAAGR